MDTIIAPIDRSLLKSELTSDNFLRRTNYGNREIYSVTHYDAPNTLQEIGRLREVTFREAGGGTGKSIDLDDYDLCEVPYRQLIVWDKDDEEIIGGYRYLEGVEIPVVNGVPQIATAKMFHFSQKFIQDYLSKTIELGRSFIQPKYQSSRNGLFSLDNLWDGLGALVIKNPNVDYFFGKVTMYPTYNVAARDYLLRFLNLYFCDEEKLVAPIEPVNLVTDINEIDAYFKGLSLDEAFKAANKKIRELGENIPPLFSAYIKLSSTMKTFGTAINKGFGDVEETGILVKISDIYDDKKARHVTF
ncbi:MAG: GNAT family N-acetyltransferase [Bacteroidales bacterium]|nr:GNAT family N-acetyltransferase [Bacteroidales bacterium]